MGSGKTTLAHQIARSAGCPAICRDEIKEGMVHTALGFVARPGDELTMRTLPVFFGVLELLLRAGVTTVAEAAFQDKVWRAGLEPLAGIARIRIVHCVVDAEVAFTRSLRRREADPLRRAHADPGPADAAGRGLAHRAFDRLSLAVPWIEVDTTDGYVPDLDEIVAFAVGRELRPVHAARPPRGHAAPGRPAWQPVAGCLASLTTWLAATGSMRV
jgi:predicted kinase